MNLSSQGDTGNGLDIGALLAAAQGGTPPVGGPPGLPPQPALGGLAELLAAQQAGAQIPGLGGVPGLGVPGTGAPLLAGLGTPPGLGTLPGLGPPSLQGLGLPGPGPLGLPALGSQTGANPLASLIAGLGSGTSPGAGSGDLAALLTTAQGAAPAPAAPNPLASLLAGVGPGTSPGAAGGDLAALFTAAQGGAPAPAAPGAAELVALLAAARGATPPPPVAPGPAVSDLTVLLAQAAQGTASLPSLGATSGTAVPAAPGRGLLATEPAASSAAPPQPVAVPGLDRLVVTQLLDSVNEEDVRNTFTKFGEVSTVTFQGEAEERCCFVTFKEKAGIIKVIQEAQNKPLKISDKPVIVDIAPPEEKEVSAATSNFLALSALAQHAQQAQQAQQAQHAQAQQVQEAQKAQEVQAAVALASLGAEYAGDDAMKAQVDQLRSFYIAQGGSTGDKPGAKLDLPPLEYKGFGTNTFRRIFISKMSAEISSDMLKEHFSRFGPVQDVYVPGDGSKGVAFVTFEHYEYAQAACDQKHHNVKPGHVALICGEAIERPERSTYDKKGKGQGKSAAPMAPGQTTPLLPGLLPGSLPGGLPGIGPVLEPGPRFSPY